MMRMTDDRILLLTRGLRQFAYGLLAVVLAVALSRRGYSPIAIGALITISLLGDFCSTYLIALYADRWGRRRTLVLLAVLMALTGMIFGVARWYPLLVVMAFCGTLGTSASETAPFLPLEQAMLPQAIAPARRTAIFARYNLVASLAGAFGALAAGVPDLLARLGIPLDNAITAMFGIYALLALGVAALVTRLSPAVEAEHPPALPEHWWQRLAPPLPHSRAIVLKLAGLFSVDALAGGLVTQTLMALYFHVRFGVDLAPLAGLFFGANLLAALSFLAAPALARRFGLLNTMVFSHLPSNILLALVALMPTFPLAALVLLLRQTLSQMDVPTRQAYTMALVAPTERTAAASVTSLARSSGSALSPVVAGIFLQPAFILLGLPFLLGGALKVGYDLALWRIFRGVKLPGKL